MVQYPIRLFDDFKLKFIKPSEVTTECDRSLNNESNKTNFNRVSSGDSIIMMTFFPVMFRFSQQTTRSNQSQEIFLNFIVDNFSRSKKKENSHSSYRTRTKTILKNCSPFQNKHRTSLMVLQRAVRTIRLNLMITSFFDCLYFHFSDENFKKS